eukprot:7394494-Prorocentrum_lima.AAC.1
MDMVASKDDFLKKAMMEELSLPSLRNPQKMEEVSAFVRTMLGEAKVRTEEETTPRSSHTCSHSKCSHSKCSPEGKGQMQQVLGW